MIQIFKIKEFYFKNKLSIISSTIKLFNIFFNFLINVFIIRQLGLSNTGLILLCLNLNILLSVVGQAGFHFSVVKFISQLAIKKKYQEIDKVIRFSTKIVFLISLLLSITFIIGIPFLNNILFAGVNFKIELGLFLTSLIFLLLRDNNTFILQGLGFPVISIFIYILLLPILLLLGIIFLPVNSTIYFSVMYLTFSILVFLLSQKTRIDKFRYLSKNKFNDNNINNNFNPKSFVSFSLSSWKIAVLTVFIVRISELIIGLLGSPIDVAIFSTSLRISMVLNITLIGASQVITRLIASNFKLNNIREIKKIHKQASIFMNIFTLPVFLFIVISPGYILGFFSDELITSGNVLRVLALANISRIIFGPNEIVLSMCGYEKFLFKSLLIGFLISLIFGIALFTQFGVMGVCLSVLIGRLTNDLVLKLKVDKYINSYKYSTK